MVFLKFLNYFFSWRNYVVGQIENHFIYPGIPRKYMESFWYSQKKKNHYETNKSTLNLKYKGLNKNPISCEFYSEVLAKFLIVNQRVEGLSNTAFIPTVLSTGCGIERILCDNDKHLRMSSNLQMWLFEWSPLHKQYILQGLVLESKRWNTGPMEEVRKFL